MTAPSLALLRLKTTEGESVYFVVEDWTDWSDPDDGSAYFYDEHSCPTNYIRVEAVLTHDDNDPHGVFDHIRTAPKPAGYDTAADKDEMIRALFPETREP